MISVKERALRLLNKGKKDFWLVVAVLSLSFCLVGQVMMSLYSFYLAHRGVIGDEVSIFVDSTLNKQRTDAVLKGIQEVSPEADLREIQPADVLEKDILRLVEAKKKVPLIIAMQFPRSTHVEAIKEAVTSIEKIKGVEAVTANFDWIKKRHSLREAIAIGIGALAVPTVLLVCMLIYQTGLRLRSFMKEEQMLLLMLGAGRFAVCGPQLLIAFWASGLSCLIGVLLLSVTMWLSVPLLESAFEVTLLPPLTSCLLICLLTACAMIFLTVLSSFLSSGQSQALKF